MTLATNHNLEQLFNLPTSEKEESESAVPVTPALPVVAESLDTLAKIESALPQVRGLEASDTEMDELSQKAIESYDNLMDLGMQVDSRFASEIFGVASQMLGHAITAKTAKLNKKLRMIDLQLKKAKLDRDSGTDPAVPTAQGTILDRNDLLKRVLNRDSDVPKL
jgi:hypothetical protein